MNDGDPRRGPSINGATATMIVEKMIEACARFADGHIGLHQLWCRVRGEKRFTAIRRIQDRRLGYLLFQLHMDFYCWMGERDDIIRRSALQIVEASRSINLH